MPAAIYESPVFSTWAEHTMHSEKSTLLASPCNQNPCLRGQPTGGPPPPRPQGPHSPRCGRCRGQGLDSLLNPNHKAAGCCLLLEGRGVSSFNHRLRTTTAWSQHGLGEGLWQEESHHHRTPGDLRLLPGCCGGTEAATALGPTWELVKGVSV